MFALILYAIITKIMHRPDRTVYNRSMDIRTEFESFTWARGAYALSDDRRAIVRNPDAPLAAYSPDAATAAAVIRAANDIDAALAVTQLVGFLSVAPNAPSEPVDSWLRAAGELQIMEAVADFADGAPPLKNFPEYWTDSMDGAASTGEIQLPDGRKLKGEDKRLHELGKAQQQVLDVRALKMKHHPPSAEEIARQRFEIRAQTFNSRARLNVRATIDFKIEPPELILRPATLADWIWYNLAGGVSGTVEYRHCLNYERCKGVFVVDLTDGNSKRQVWCPRTMRKCQQQYRYYANKLQEKQRGQGSRRK